MTKIEPPITILLDNDYSMKFRKLRAKHQKNTDFLQELIDNEEERRIPVMECSNKNCSNTAAFVIIYLDTDGDIHKIPTCKDCKKLPCFSGFLRELINV